jgi:outer membrane protein assembly factor BamB
MVSRMLLYSCLVWILSATMVQPADWPQFRGPGGLGVAPDKDLPTSWGPQNNVVWKTELPGPGSSSPIVVGDRIFLTCYTGYGTNAQAPGDLKDLKRILLCLDRPGKVLWSRDVPTTGEDAPFKSYNALHGYASSTPVSDGKNVYVFFGTSGVRAYDLEGKELWHTSVGSGTNGWGTATSPVLFQDLVIVNASVESKSLVALNKHDGKVAWAAKGMSQSWNTPLLVNVAGRQELVVSVSGRLLGFDPQTGGELWRCAGITDYVCPSVVAKEGVVYAIGARANTALAVKAGGKGDVSQTHLLWKISKGSNVSSPVFYEGHLYWASDNKGFFYCVQADKGTVVYEERLEPRYERIYASPTVADGKFYLVSRIDGAYVLDAQPKFKILAHNKLDDPSVFNASPVVHNGQLLLRSNRYLYCIGKK